MAGTFEIYRDKKGEFRFRLKASNGEILLASEGYKAKTGAKNGVASVMKNAAMAERFEKRPGSGGKFRFVLKAGNRQVIGASEAYDTERSCEGGIQSVMKHAPNAKIDDQTAAAAKK